jgi:hypothetical protein
MISALPLEQGLPECEVNVFNSWQCLSVIRFLYSAKYLIKYQSYNLSVAFIVVFGRGTKSYSRYKTKVDKTGRIYDAYG